MSPSPSLLLSSPLPSPANLFFLSPFSCTLTPSNSFSLLCQKKKKMCAIMCLVLFTPGSVFLLCLMQWYRLCSFMCMLLRRGVQSAELCFSSQWPCLHTHYTLPQYHRASPFFFFFLLTYCHTYMHQPHTCTHVTHTHVLYR